MEALLTMLLSEKVGGDVMSAQGPRSAEADQIRKGIRDGMQGGPGA